MNYKVELTKEAIKDIKKLTPKLQTKLKNIIKKKIALEPYSGKKLIGDLKGFLSVRLNYQDRIVYFVNESNKTIYIVRTKTHYGD